MATTHLDQQFSPLRLFWLVKNRTFRDIVPLGIGAAILFGLNLLSIIFTKQAAFNEPAGQIFNVVIIVTSLLMASGSFQEMHSGKSGTDWLLFPASPLEKYLGTLIQYLIVVPVLAVAGTVAVSALSGLLALIVGGSAGSIFNPFKLNLEMLAGSMIGLLLFVAGSAAFRKRALLKTVGVIVAWGTVVAILLTTGAWLILQAGGHVGNDGFGLRSMNGSFGWSGNGIPQNLLDVPTMASKIFFYVLTPLAALPYIYFKVREKEAQDAVQ